MARDYEKIEKEVTLTGFFSEYLPPCFTLEQRMLCHPPPENCDLIAPYTFTMSKFSKHNSRRTIYIPEVGAYLVACKYIKENDILRELIEVSTSSTSSFSPIIGEDDHLLRHEEQYDYDPYLEFDENDMEESALTTHAVQGEEDPSTFLNNIAKKIVKSTGSHNLLKLDIANCYASFYMHMIPAIFLGIDNAEREYKKSRYSKLQASGDYCKYAKLDKIIRRQNLEQTNGLLVGPLHSRIIIEAMLSRIDRELHKKEITFSRYVDDYEVYLQNNDEWPVINTFTNVLKRYGFSLNSEKCEKVPFPYYPINNLDKLYRLSIQNNQLTTTELIELFNSFILLDEKEAKGAVRYLLKLLEKNNVHISDYEVYKSFLISLLRNNERALINICSLFIKNNKIDFDLKEIEILSQLLIEHIKYSNDLEVLWLLYLFFEKIAKDKLTAITPHIINSDNELAQLMLLVNEVLSEEQITIVKNKANSWILLYELFAYNHIGESEFYSKLQVNKNKNMYKKFKDHNLHFCSKSQSAKSLFWDWDFDF